MTGLERLWWSLVDLAKVIVYGILIYVVVIYAYGAMSDLVEAWLRLVPWPDFVPR